MPCYMFATILHFSKSELRAPPKKKKPEDPTEIKVRHV
jgi:hypothetical protein